MQNFGENFVKCLTNLIFDTRALLGDSHSASASLLAAAAAAAAVAFSILAQILCVFCS